MFKNVIPMFKYAWLAIKHKWFLMEAGRKLKVPWILILLHDLSKFSWKELPGYGRQFCGSKDDPRGWAETWLHHQNTAPHHSEYWIMRSGTKPFPDGCPLPMPEKYVREMIADWMAASKAYEGRWPDPAHWKWFDDHFCKLDLHPDTRIMVLDIIKKIWGFVPVDGENFEVTLHQTH
jgi:hypothetical protein